MKREFIMTYEDGRLQELIAAASTKNHPVVHTNYKGCLPFPQDDQLVAFLNHDYFFQRRYKLEYDQRFRHPIPYGVFYRVNANNEPEIFVYQRTKETAEGRLAGKHSIGVGGHIDAAAFFEEFGNDSDSEVDLQFVLMNELVREFTEEFSYATHPDDETANAIEPPFPALMINSDFEQDRFHLGLVPFTRLPVSIHGVVSVEQDQVAVGFFTVDQIREQFYDNLESWSKLIFDADVSVYLKVDEKIG